jgi:hypothetical protein
MYAVHLRSAMDAPVSRIAVVAVAGATAAEKRLYFLSKLRKRKSRLPCYWTDTPDGLEPCCRK